MLGSHRQPSQAIPQVEFSAPLSLTARIAAPALRWTRRAPLLRLTAALLLLALAARPVAVQAEGPLEVVQVGWEGFVVPSTWTPVRLKVSDGAADAVALVEVILKNRISRGAQGPTYEQPVASYAQELPLPAGVSKEVTVWAPMDGGLLAEARLVINGQAAAAQPLELPAAQSYRTPLIGVLGDAPQVAQALRQIEIPYQGLPAPISVAKISPADLPVQGERLGALGAMVVEGRAAAGLTAEQRAAIASWVKGGGHLVVVGGPDARLAASVLPDGVLQAGFRDLSASTDLTALFSWAGASPPETANGPATPIQAQEGHLLAGSPNLPLAWRLSLGNGDVTLLAANPALQPFADWGGASHLWKRTLDPVLAVALADRGMRMPGASNTLAMLLSAVHALPPGVFPDWPAVLLLLGGFTLAAGPIAHMLFRRMNRRGWLWGALPALALATTGATYLGGMHIARRDVVSYTVSHVRLPEAGNDARQSLATGFFAPTLDAVTVQMSGDVSVRAANQAGGAGMSYFIGTSSGPMGISVPVLAGQTVTAAQSGAAPFRVIWGRDTRVEFTGGQWGMRTVAFERPLQQAPVVMADLVLEGGLLKGTLRNDSSYHLEHAALVVGDVVAQVGAIAPGQTASVVLDPAGAAGSPPYRRGGQPFSYRLLGQMVVASGGGPPASSGFMGPGSVMRLPNGDQMVMPPDADVQRKARLVDAAFSNKGPMGVVLPLTFIALTQQPVGAGFPQAGDHPPAYLTMLEQPVRFSTPHGPFTLPAGLMPGQIIETRSQGIGGGGTRTPGGQMITFSDLNSGSVVYEFRSPIPQHARVAALLLKLQQLGLATPAGGKSAPPRSDQLAGPPEDGVFALYDWQAGAWQPLPGGNDDLRIDAPAAYINAQGAIRLRVSAPDGSSVRFVPPQLSLEGSAGP